MKHYPFTLVAIITTIRLEMYTCTPSGYFYVLPDDLANASCPSYPCADINQYSVNMSNMSNVKFVFLPGKHSLTSTMKMQHVHNVTMAGVNHDNLVPAVIFSQSTRACISFVNASNITIANLVFSYCEPKKWHNNVQIIAEGHFSTCYYCNIINVTLIRYGLVIINLLGESFLHNITVYSYAAEYCLSEWCYEGIEIINYGKNSYNISHNLIYISKITIAGNGGSSQTACKNKKIGMYISIELNTTLILNDLLFHLIDAQPVLKIEVSCITLSRITVLIKTACFSTTIMSLVTQHLKDQQLKLIFHASIQKYFS